MSAWITVGDIDVRLGKLNPNGTSKTADVFAEIIEEACDWVEAQTGRTILSASYTRIFDGNGSPVLPLPVQPVTAASSLYIGTSSVTIGTAEAFRLGTADAYYTTTKIVYPPKFPRGYGVIKATWTAGYSAATVPERIKALACSVAILKWKERERYGDQRRTVSGQTMDYTRELQYQDMKTLKELTDWRYMYGDCGIDV